MLRFSQTAQLLTSAEVAERLRVKPETVRLWIRRGVLPAVNVATGARSLPYWRVSEADLAAFVESGRVSR